MSNNKTIKSALISVFSKEGLEPIVKELDRLGVTIYSTGGTQKFINDLGIKVVPVEDVTSYPSILGGRVKTLHPKVFGGILNRSSLASDQTEIDQAQQMAELFGQTCAANSPDIFQFVDTVSATRDIDILRALLGDEKLNWLGKSYGTFLGATYADLFPERVGRMLLDGAIDPTLTNEKLSFGQALSFELALTRFVDDCVTKSDCPLSASGAAGVSEVGDLLIELDANPITLDDGRLFTQAMGTLGVVGSLYDKQYGWPELRTNLGLAFDDDFSGLASSVDFYTGRQSDGSYKDNSNDAIAAVNCLDRPDRATTEETAALASEWKKVAPNFGEYLAWSNISCSYWQAEATGVPKEITAPGTPTILVVGTVNDPATPYAWSQALAAQLSKGVLLTLDGDGHTAYYQGSKCIDEIVDNFYLTGEAEDGITCTDGP